MKTFKVSFLSALTLILGLGLMSGSFAQRTAEAGRVDLTPTIQVNNVQRFTGLYLHAIYGIRKAGIIGISPIPNLEKSNPVQVKRVESNSVVFPPIAITKEPFRGSYNVVVFVISAQPTITWMNVDQGISNQYQFLQKVDRNVVDAFTAQNGIEAVLNINL